MDLVIAVSHIVAGIHPLAGSPDFAEEGACKALGVLNEFALIASNIWYIFLAVDLLRAIRNPFQYVCVCIMCTISHFTRNCPNEILS